MTKKKRLKRILEVDELQGKKEWKHTWNVLVIWKFWWCFLDFPPRLVAGSCELIVGCNVHARGTQ